MQGKKIKFRTFHCRCSGKSLMKYKLWKVFFFIAVISGIWLFILMIDILTGGWTCSKCGWHDKP